MRTSVGRLVRECDRHLPCHDAASTGLRAVKKALQAVTAKHLGLPVLQSASEAHDAFGAHPRHVRYQHVAESPGRYSVGVFVLPPGTSLPLHDHPGMTVLSQLLYGSVAVTSYDWVDKGRAKLVLDETMSAPSTLSLFPTHGGNIHAFASAAPGGCAFLDVLTPPYDFDNGRPCNYYTATSSSSSSSSSSDSATQQLSVLQQVPIPTDFLIMEEALHITF